MYYNSKKASNKISTTSGKNTQHSTRQQSLTSSLSQKQRCMAHNIHHAHETISENDDIEAMWHVLATMENVFVANLHSNYQTLFNNMSQCIADKKMKQQFANHCAAIIQSNWKAYQQRKYYKQFLPIYRRFRALLLAVVTGWKVRRISSLKTMKNRRNHIKDLEVKQQCRQARIAKRDYMFQFDSLSAKGRWVALCSTEIVKVLNVCPKKVSLKQAFLRKTVDLPSQSQPVVRQIKENSNVSKNTKKRVIVCQSSSEGINSEEVEIEKINEKTTRVVLGSKVEERPISSSGSYAVPYCEFNADEPAKCQKSEIRTSRKAGYKQNMKLNKGTSKNVGAAGKANKDCKVGETTLRVCSDEKMKIIPACLPHQIEDKCNMSTEIIHLPTEQQHYASIYLHDYPDPKEQSKFIQPANNCICLDQPNAADKHQPNAGNKHQKQSNEPLKNHSKTVYKRSKGISLTLTNQWIISSSIPPASIPIATDPNKQSQPIADQEDICSNLMQQILTVYSGRYNEKRMQLSQRLQQCQKMNKFTKRQTHSQKHAVGQNRVASSCSQKGGIDKVESRLIDDRAMK